MSIEVCAVQFPFRMRRLSSSLLVSHLSDDQIVMKISFVFVFNSGVQLMKQIKL